MPAPELSFVVPAYNAAAVVGDTLASIRDYGPACRFEVVVVDDASTDGTGEVVASFADSLELRLERNEKNLGGGATRNRAIALARADLLYMLDSDNLLLPGSVDGQLGHVGVDSEVVSVEVLEFFRDGTDEVTHRWTMRADGARSTLTHLFVTPEVPAAHGNLLYTRAAYDGAGGYEEGRGATDAWTFGFKQLLAGFDVTIAAGTTYRHRIERRDQPSYWLREASANDVQALAVVREHAARLPADLQEKVALLRDTDRFFDVVASGLLSPQVPLDDFRHHLNSMRTPPRRSLLSAVRQRLSRLAG